MKTKKKKILYAVLLPILAAVLLLTAYTVYSLAHTSRALHTLGEYQALYPDLTIAQEPEGAVSLLPADEAAVNHIGIVFYQGASVEPMAYVPLLAGIAEAGYSVYAPQFPCGMAVFQPDAAEEVMAQHPEIDAWYIAGHSMGGRCASKYGLTGGGVEGVISISSPVDEKLAETDLPLLMLYGDADGIYRGVGSDEALPEDTTVCCIEGANHAQFGDYGRQLLDHEASISPEKQQEEGIECILNWLQQYDCPDAA